MNQESPSKELEQKGDLSDKLLPCPFCGEKTNLYLYNDGNEELTHYNIQCAECGADGSVTADKKFAEELWNTRIDNGLAKLVNTLTDENSKLRYAGYEAAKQLTTTQQALDSAVEALKWMVAEFDPDLIRPDCCGCNRKDAGAKLVHAKAKATLASITKDADQHQSASITAENAKMMPNASIKE